MTAETEPAMVTAVLEVARRQLGEVGPNALSLRSIAREVGVVPSALYRYLPGRQAILTELIRTGYQRLGDEVQETEAAVARDDHRGRWLATWRAVHAWARAHPHEYALLFGTPVVGYQAPADTIRPATIVVLTLARIAIDGAGPIDSQAPPSGALLADAEQVARLMPELGLPEGADAAPAHVLTVIDAWTTLFGAISFELFGHYERSITAHEEHLDALAHASADRLGLPPSPS